MRVLLTTPGKFKNKEYKDLVLHYSQLASRYCETKHVEIPLSKSDRNSDDNAFLRFWNQRPPRSALILLNERAAAPSSREFADFLNQQKDCSVSELVFAIGGAHEYGDEVKKIAKKQLSLSKLTFAHELAAVVLAEQVFRGFSILAGHPYHND